jgi:Domain of unknown function (DUF4326)
MPNKYASQITVVSKRASASKAPTGYTLIDVDRNSPLGNPFLMNGEHERDLVCNEFASYLSNHLGKNNVVDQEVTRIANLIRSSQHVALRCWCKPRRCHGDDIRLAVMVRAASIDMDQL